jgi:hypothetical protein
MKRLALAALLAGACIPSQGPMMSPGQDCLECHGGGGGGGGAAVPNALDGGGEDDGKTWSVAGTAYAAPSAQQGVQGATIHITDATGWHFTIRSNAAGNFYTAEHVTFPLQVALELNGQISSMTTAVTYGGCNSCHGAGNRVAPGSRP